MDEVPVLEVFALKALQLSRGDWIDSQVRAPVVITADRVPPTKAVVAGRDLFLGYWLEASSHGQPHQMKRLMPRADGGSQFMDRPQDLFERVMEGAATSTN